MASPNLSDSPSQGTMANVTTRSGHAVSPDSVDAPPPSKALRSDVPAKLPPGHSHSRLSLDRVPSASSYSVVSVSVLSAEHGAHADDDAAWLAPHPAPEYSSNRWRARWEHFWLEYKGVVLMILAQMSSATMATTARLLQTMDEDGDPLSTFQVLFVRMSVTMVASLVYMRWARVPEAPFGAPGIRGLLALRGFGGFFGVFGLYYSLIYLPLAEATVITFLAPLLAAWLCSMIMKTPFTYVHKIAGFVSMGGVIMIAQPFKFLNDTADPTITTNALVARSHVSNSTLGALATNSTASSLAAAVAAVDSAPTVTPSQHAIAVAVGLLGVCGASCAYTTISMIGKRAHPLISVNYFATWCTLVSAGALLLLPQQAPFRLPASTREWLLMLFLGCSGFIMQFLLTTALSHDRNRATGLNMVYTQMLFALVLDRLVWGTTPGWASIVGSSMVLGSAVWVAVSREKAERREGLEAQAQAQSQAQRQRPGDEEVGLVAGMDMNEDDEEVVADGHDRAPDLPHEVRRHGSA